MSSKYVTNLPILPFATFMMVGILTTIDYRFDFFTPYKTAYSIFFGFIAYLISIHHVNKIQFDSMLIKKIFAFLLGLAIVGFLHYVNFSYERSNVWGSLIASLFYVWILMFGLDFSLNPLFFE